MIHRPGFTSDPISDKKERRVFCYCPEVGVIMGMGMVPSVTAGREKTERCLEWLPRCYTEWGCRGSKVHPLPALGCQGILEGLLGKRRSGLPPH